MALILLLCLSLLCDVQSTTEDATATINGFESSVLTENLSFTTTRTVSRETGTIINDIGPSTLKENSSFTVEETVSIETGTIINDIGPSTLTENFSFTAEETASREIGTIINDIGPSTFTENFRFTTTEIDPQKTAIETNSIGSNRSSNSTELTNNLKHTAKDTISTETVTVLSDIESTTDSPSYTTTGTETSECNATKSVDKLQKYQELVNFTKQLDGLFEQTMEARHSFVKTKNQTIGEFTTNLAKNYLQISRKFVHDAQLQNTTIRCENNSKYEKYKIDNINEYEEKLEIVEILLNQLGKMAVNETHSDLEFQNKNVSEGNVTEKQMVLFNELNSIVKLNKRIKELDTLLVEQNETYGKSLKSRDLDNMITTLTEIIKFENEILHIIRNSDSLKYLYDEEYRPKSNMIRQLVNSSNVEGKINRYEKYLSEEYEEHELVEKILQLDEIIRPAVLGTIFVVGITANGVLLLVFVRHADMRTAPNVMIINLNVCDILALIFNILLYNAETLSTDWTLGTALCKLYRFGRYLTLGLSIYSIVVISLQRYLALTDYFSFGFRCRFFGKFQPILNVLFVWVLASALASPRGIKAQVDSLVCWSGTAHDREFFKKLEYVDFAVYCVIPFILIAVTSGVSSLRLKRSVRNMPGEAIGQEKALRARVVSSNILLALTVVFAICYLPYFLFMVYSRNVDYNATFMTKKYASFGLYCLIHSNPVACFNPIALFIASSKYRKYMRIYICYGKFYGEGKNSDAASAESNDTAETRM